MTASLNWVDYIIIAIFFLSMMSGFFRGFVKEIVSLATLIAAFIIAVMFSNSLAEMFTHTQSVQNAVNQASSTMGSTASQSVSYLAIGLSFILLFIGTIIVGAIISSILNLAFQTGILSIGNRFMGAIFGLVRGFIFNIVLIFLVQLTGFASTDAWQQSQLVKTFQPQVEWLAQVVSPSLANLKDRFGQTIEGVGSKIQSVTSGGI